MEFNNDPEWLRRQAALEDGCMVSVGVTMQQTSYKVSRCNHPPAAGMVRVFMSPGMLPQLFDKWSTSGHAWAVFDIPEALYREVVKANEEYLRTQNALRIFREGTKKFCNCGSDHADLPIEYD